MKAGYLVSKWIEKKLSEWSQQSLINYIAASVGETVASEIVGYVVELGAGAAATYVATLLGASASLAGPIGTIVGFASGWL